MDVRALVGGGVEGEGGMRWGGCVRRIARRLRDNVASEGCGREGCGTRKREKKARGGSWRRKRPRSAEQPRPPKKGALQSSARLRREQTRHQLGRHQGAQATEARGGK